VKRAGEYQRITVVVSAHLHAAMTARVEKHMNCVLPIPAQNDFLFAHARNDEVARLLDLALVSDEQPGTRENLLQLLLVDALVNVDFATDEALFEVDQFSNGAVANGVIDEYQRCVPPVSIS
jgi:hypothetical protein